MANCTLNIGYNTPCPSVGGIKEIYLGTYTDGLIYTFDATDQVIGLTNGPATLYKFDQLAETSGLKESAIVSEDFTKGVSYKQTLSIKLLNVSNTQRQVIKELNQAIVFAVVVGNNNETFILGVEFGGKTTKMDSSLGMKFDDENSYTIEITFKSVEPMHNFDSSLLGTLDFPVL